MNILIFGTGLIGGSFALALRKIDPSLRFGGWDLSRENREKALKLGVVDEIFDTQDAAIDWAECVILTVPVSAILNTIGGLLDNIRKDQFIIDFGSTKNSICQAIVEHPYRSRYIAAHPIAGTEHSGPEAAFAELYHGKVMIACEHEKSDINIVKVFARWCESLVMSLTFMSAEEHDKHLAYISHLSHVIAFGLSQTVLDKEKNGEVILELAGSGFASTVRLAKSSPEMWAPILLDNKVPVLESLEALMDQLGAMKQLIQGGDAESLQEYLKEGRKIRKILD
ncbi:MAG: prephenate dehydrogenase [Cytophagales bacterium]|nr:prephenate dehydrogenase [Cytophagales bacterium]